MTLASRLGLPQNRPPRVLAVGAHPDDIEIGAGGTILRLIEECPEAAIEFVVLTGSEERAAEARASATALGASSATPIRIAVLDGRDGHLPYSDGSRIKDALAAAVVDNPDLVLAPCLDDAHQDHEFAAALAWQLFRRSTILEYEIPKWDGDVVRPNLYVLLRRPVAEAKVQHLARAFPSQADRDWFSEDTFRGVLRLRGVECRAPEGFAEAFVIRKLVV